MVSGKTRLNVGPVVMTVDSPLRSVIWTWDVPGLTCQDSVFRLVCPVNVLGPHLYKLDCLDKDLLV